MAANFEITSLVASTVVNALTATLNTGVIRAYAGTIPASANASLSSNTILAELSFSSSAFAAAAGGIATANAITAEDSCPATGTATFFRLFQSGGTTVTAQGTIGTSGEDMNLNSVSVQAGATFTITAATITQPMT